MLDLPTDRPAAAVSLASRRCRPWRARRRTSSAGSRRWPASEGVTLYTTLLAAFQVLLGRYTGQDDFLVGSPFAGRSRPGFEEVIGYFINMLPLRADLSGDPTFRDAAAAGSARPCSTRWQHQDYPFPLLVERLNVEARPQPHAAGPGLFTLEKAHRSQELGAWRFFLPPSGARLTVGGLEIEQYYVEQRSSQFDLEMVFEEGDGTLEGMLRYNSDLFEPETVRRMVGHFLDAAGRRRRRPGPPPLATCRCLTEAERPAGAPRMEPDRRADYPQESVPAPPVRAAGRPDARGDRALRRRRLADLRRAGDLVEPRWRIACAGCGVGRRRCVALYLERSPEMIAAILGTLKAGAAYVPLDPATPAERLRTRPGRHRARRCCSLSAAS